MTRNYLAGLALLPVLLALAGACKSAPPAVVESTATAATEDAAESSPVPAPDPETARSLEAASEGLEAARKKVHDFGGPELMPEETAAADARYGELAPLRDRLPGAAAEVIAASGELAGVYEDLFERLLPMKAALLSEEILDARNEAVYNGIVLYSVERLSAADDVCDEALRLYQEEADYYAALETAIEARDRYRALAWGSAAKNDAFEIEFYRFGDYEAETVEEAARAFEEGLAAYDAGNVPIALAAAEASMIQYRAILNRGMKSLAETRRGQAEEERRFAVENRAPVAARLEFENADRIFNLGGSAFRREEYHEAANLFFQAEFSFASASTIAAEKRARAEAAIREAEERTSASEEVARNAESILNEGVEE